MRTGVSRQWSAIPWEWVDESVAAAELGHSPFPPHRGSAAAEVHFAAGAFAAEEDIYRQEGIVWSAVEYHDNQV